MDPTRPSVRELVFVPAVVTFAVTLLRLTGELMGWSEFLFSRKAAGGASPIGIVWLVPLFGIYFAWRLSRTGELSVTGGRTIAYALLGLLIAVVAIVAASLVFEPLDMWGLIVVALASVVAAWVTLKGWPELANALFVYGLAARIPVAIVMFFAIMGDWGTHYDVAPDPEFPQMGWFAKWLLIGLIPQLTIWVAFTMIVGALFGGLAKVFLRQTASK